MVFYAAAFHTSAVLCFVQCAPANRGKMFEPVFRHFLAGISKNSFQDIIAYTIESKSYFIEIFVRPAILAVGFKKGKGRENARAP